MSDLQTVIGDTKANSKDQKPVEDKRNGDEESATLCSACKKFAENTSFPGIGLINKTRNPFRRILWISFLILGTSMAIYQSLDLIKGYRNYQVFSVHSEKQNKSVLFPSITFCPPLPVLWDKIYPNHTIYKELENFMIEQTNFSKWEELSVTSKAFYRRFLIHELRQLIYDLEEFERNEILPQLDDVFVAVYKSRIINMKSYFISTYIPAYGRCFTFNPGLPGYERVETSALEDIQFIIHLNPEQIPPFVDNNEMLVNIHTTATAPELHTGRLMKVRRGQEVSVPLSLTEYHRLSSPYPSECVQETTKLMNMSLFFSDDRPYEYERRACKEKFAYDYMLKKWNCSDATTPLQSRKMELCLDTLPLSEDPLPCKVSCNSLVYHWSPLIRTYLYADEDLEELDFFLSFARLIVSNRTFFLRRMKNDLIFMKFKMRSMVFDVFTEQPRYSFSDIVGAIGGNIGLWIGFSIVSLMEVFDFLFRVLLKLCKPKKNNK